MFNKISKHAQNTESMLKSVFYISLFSGFMILSFYSAEIHYFPVNSFNSAVYFLLLMALIGFSCFICIIFPLGFSPFLWLMMLKEKDLCVFLFNEENAECYFKNYSEGRLNLSKEDASSLFKIYLGYFYLASMLWIICLWFAFGFSSYHWLVIVFLCILFGALYIAEKADKRNRWLCRLYLLVSTLFCSLILVEAFIMAARFSKWSNYEYIVYFFAFILCSGFFLSPTKKEISIKIRITFSSLITFCLLMATVGPWNFSYSVLQRYVIGGMEDVNMLVDQDECSFLNKRSETPICRLEDKLYVVSNIVLLWRAGEYFIRPKNEDQTFILPYRGGRNISFEKKKKINKA